MKYCNINSSDDLKVIGHYPQTFIKEEDFSRIYSDNGQRQVKASSFPDFEPNCILRLNDKAFPTNYLNGDIFSFGIIVDEKFREVLEKHNLPEHRFYPVEVLHKGKSLQYYWFHYIIDIWEYAYIEKSSAMIYKKFDFEIEKIIPIPDLSSILDFESKLSFRQDLRLNELCLKEGFPNYDVIKIGKVGFRPRLFSEKLVNALKDAGMTGFEVMPFDKIK